MAKLLNREFSKLSKKEESQFAEYGSSTLLVQLRLLFALLAFSLLLAISSTFFVIGVIRVPMLLKDNARWLFLYMFSPFVLVNVMRTKLSYSFLMFLLLVCSSVIWSKSPNLSSQRIANYVLLVLVLKQLIQFGILNFSYLSRFFRTFCSFLILGLVLSSMFNSAFLGGRFRGFFSNPNSLGLTIMMIFPHMLSGYFENSDNKSNRRFYLVILSFMAYFVIISGSRTAFFGIGVSLALRIIITSSYRRFSRGIVVVFTVISIVLLVYLVFSGELFGKEGLSGRIYYWQESISQIAKAPILGIGFGHYDRSLELVSDYRHVQAFSSYLVLAIDLGLLGLLLFLTLVVKQLWTYVMIIRRIASQESRKMSLSIAFFSMFLCGLAAGITESYMFSAGNIICLFFTISLVVPDILKNLNQH